MPEHTQSHPNPALLWDFVTGYQRAAAIRAAIDLDIFSAIGAGAKTAEDVAAKCGAPLRGIRILCDYFTAAGFLEKSDGEYSLTPDSAAFLDRRSPAYMGGIAGFLQLEPMRQNFWDLTDTIKRGTVPPDRPDALGVEHPMWVAFAHSMAAMMSPMAEFIAGFVKPKEGAKFEVLDVAAGHGIFGVTVAKKHPSAHITALDWPGVLEVAAANAAKAGVSDRHSLKPGSAFEVEFGGPYDLVLLTNFFHHFDQETCISLMKKVHAALAPGGQAITLEFIPDENRVTPPPEAQFALTMLANTPHGDAYTFNDFKRMFEAAGFDNNELVEIPFGAHRLVVSRK